MPPATPQQRRRIGIVVGGTIVFGIVLVICVGLVTHNVALAFMSGMAVAIADIIAGLVAAVIAVVRARNRGEG
jgi:LytS/YehU family sensor histidine kinase